MVMSKEEVKRMRTLLSDAVTTLCRSGLRYKETLLVEGLIGITLDEGDIVLVNVNKTFETKEFQEKKAAEEKAAKKKAEEERLKNADIIIDKVIPAKRSAHPHGKPSPKRPRMQMDPQRRHSAPGGAVPNLQIGQTFSLRPATPTKYARMPGQMASPQQRMWSPTGRGGYVRGRGGTIIAGPRTPQRYIRGPIQSPSARGMRGRPPLHQSPVRMPISSPPTATVTSPAALRPMVPVQMMQRKSRESVKKDLMKIEILDSDSDGENGQKKRQASAAADQLQTPTLHAMAASQLSTTTTDTTGEANSLLTITVEPIASNSPPTSTGPMSDGQQLDRYDGIKTPEQPLVHNGPEHEASVSDGQPSPMPNMGSLTRISTISGADTPQPTSIATVTMSESQTQITPAQNVTNITRDQIDSLMAIETLIAETVAQEKASQQPDKGGSPEATSQTVQILTVKEEAQQSASGSDAESTQSQNLSRRESDSGASPARSTTSSSEQGQGASAFDTFASIEEAQMLQGMSGQSSNQNSNESAVFPHELTEIDKKNKQLIIAARVRAAVKCGNCKKPRCTYSSHKLTLQEKQRLLNHNKYGTYTCGSKLGEGCEQVVVRRAIDCHSPIEVSYYGAATIVLPKCCYHCGDENNLMDDACDYMQDLHKKYLSVRPICSNCRNKGKEARTWGHKLSKD